MNGFGETASLTNGRTNGQTNGRTNGQTNERDSLGLQRLRRETKNLWKIPRWHFMTRYRTENWAKIR